MGYVTEGVTTYMGDRILFESGVFFRSIFLKNYKKYFKDIFIMMVENTIQ